MFISFWCCRMFQDYKNLKQNNVGNRDNNLLNSKNKITIGKYK